MKILLTNDDGVSAPGLRAVAEAICDAHACVIVAPHDERSATGHSISLNREIWVEKVDHGARWEAFSVEGTPADCVKFALIELKQKFDLIISGINLGLNTGVSVYYSGTVSAVREGFINGVPGMAFSQARESGHDFLYVQGLIRQMLSAFEQNAIPHDQSFLNINIPALKPHEIKGVRITKQAESRFAEWYEPQTKPHSNGKKPYLLRGGIELKEGQDTSDEEALRKGYVSITPLHLDITHHESVNLLRSSLGDFLR